MKKLMLLQVLLLSFLTDSALAFREEQDVCPSDNSFESTISEVRKIKEGYFQCRVPELRNWFYCSDISPFTDGSVVTGLKVVVDVRFQDACHVPGACGPRACMLTSSARLAVVCK